MKIRDVKVLILEGGPNPVEGYAEDNPAIEGFGGRKAQIPGKLEQLYVQVLTDDEEIDGISPGIPSQVPRYIVRDQLKPVLIGKDPEEYESLWNQMYSSITHSRRGEGKLAIAAVDLALWDIIGKIRGQPVYRLLGGPVQEKIQTYLATLGWNTAPESVAKHSIEGVEKGFTAFKWYLHYGPSAGIKGLNANVELVKTFRDAVGYDVDLMIDCSRQMSLHYMLKFSRRLERYEVAWLEEPFSPEDLASYVALSKSTSIPVAGIEHVYDRWGFKDIIEQGACSILQPDIGWAGGITEMMKICDLASAYGLPVVPHSNESFRANLHLLMSRSRNVCPLQEYNPRFQANWQYFFKDRVDAEHGYAKAKSTPGLGIEFDPNKISKITEI